MYQNECGLLIGTFNQVSPAGQSESEAPRQRDDLYRQKSVCSCHQTLLLDLSCHWHMYKE